MQKNYNSNKIIKMYWVITVWQVLAMNFLISRFMVKAMECLSTFLLLDWNTHFPSCEECCLLSLLRKSEWRMALPNAMPLSLTVCICPLATPEDGLLALINFKGFLGTRQRLHKMGPSLCYNCCSIQLFQATWPGSSSPKRAVCWLNSW